jgi:hypothetical protein
MSGGFWHQGIETILCKRRDICSTSERWKMIIQRAGMQPLPWPRRTLAMGKCAGYTGSRVHRCTAVQVHRQVLQQGRRLSHVSHFQAQTNCSWWPVNWFLSEQILQGSFLSCFFVLCCVSVVLGLNSGLRLIGQSGTLPQVPHLQPLFFLLVIFGRRSHIYAQTGLEHHPPIYASCCS